MASNLTIESPNFDKIEDEAGQFTRDATSLLWSALNFTRQELRRNFRQASDMLQPKVLQYSPSASVDNLDLQGCSVLEFTGSTAVNFTGMRAPETAQTRVVFVYVSGTGTITVKQESASSESANRIRNASGADVSLTTDTGGIWIYLSGKWREIA